MPEKMADEQQRNFRSTYYEKVGCKSVEERKSLDILLKEKPINMMKLKQFCLRFTIPAGHRHYLWKLLLGVSPLYTDSHDFIMEQRTIIYQDLHRALVIMRIINETVTKAKVFHAMWLLENKQLYLGLNISHSTNFSVIADNLLDIFDNDVETYWICKGFYELTQKIVTEMPKLIELTKITFEKEDYDIYNHLVAIGALNRLPYEQWYSSCFAKVLSVRALIRIWDKICGGSIKIVIFVLIVLLVTFKRSILQMSDVESIVKLVENIKEEHETADLIVNKAIELWQQNKGHNEFLSNQHKMKGT